MKINYRKQKSKKGMTLIEVVVASVILVIAISALLFSFVIYMKIVKNNSYQFEATRLLNNEFEKIQNSKDKTLVYNIIAGFITGTNGDFTGGESGATPKVVSTLGMDSLSTTFYIEYDVTSVFPHGGSDIYSDPSLFKIIGKVSWDFDGSRRNIMMTMYSNEIYK